MVYAKTPLDGPAQVLEYLSRYTHRTAISNERIASVGTSEVAFKVRADAHGGKRTVRLTGMEFVRRFLQHVLPSGLKRIRHYGVLASSCKAVKLGAARLALEMPVIDPRAPSRCALSWPGWPGLMWTCARAAGRGACMSAPHCQVLSPQLPAPGTATVWPQGRGPP